MILIRLEQKQIIGIKFNIMSPETIRKMAVVKIVTPETYDEDGYPVDGGLMDRRLGTVTPGLRCKTCGGKFGECPGHFGVIELARPVIHIGYAKYIAKILKVICRNCSRVRLTKEERSKFLERLKKYKGSILLFEIFDEIIKTVKDRKTCPHCNAVQYEIKFENPYNYVEINPEEQDKRKRERKLTPIDIRERLEKIPDDDLIFLGLDENNRPEWMVLTALPVPPVTVRPSIILETGERSEDDLTHKLVDIVRINKKLMDALEAGAPQPIIEDLWDLLQYHVATYINNEISGMPPAKHRSGRPLKTLAQRLKGKEGRFRGNLSGKRVNYSARTVISPDPNLSLNEVGVPLEVAKELTVPVRVTMFNKEFLKQLIRNGPHKYPGANYIERPDGVRINLARVKNLDEVADKLDIGWVVHRHLMDGDIVLFNRQPSLHRMSMMAHIVKVLPGRTFRLNLTVCPPYNADFDGDEMNLHVPQTEEARAEARILMLVQTQILSPRFGGPIIGCIHDHISGSYLLTKRGTKISREELIDLLYIAGILEDVYNKLGDKKEFTGKEVFSLFLPDDINIKFKSKLCKSYGCEKCLEENCPHDAFVVIRNGKLIRGVIDEKAIGAFAGEVVDIIAKKHGLEAARKFLDSYTKFIIAFLMRRGFTTGIDDEDLPQEAIERIEEVLQESIKKVKEVIKMYEEGLLEPLPGRSLEETLEMKIMQILSEARDTSGRIANEYLEKQRKENHARIMAITGARGSLLNITQMAACLGQQSVRGERVKRGFINRVLSHFKKGDLGAKARGFVASSYKKGLHPVEYFFHAAGGREGLVDTAIRTSQSGYMQRRLINALQDLKVEYDGTVRDARGVIVQFKYGDDGIDPSRSDWGKTLDVKKIIEGIIGEKRER